MTGPRDPITYSILNGMLGDIRHMLEQSPPRIMGATVLIMAAIDALGHLDRPATKNGDTSRDFQEWVRKYLKVGDITTAEWWASRNAMIHSYGSMSHNHVHGNVPVILIVAGNTYPVRREQAMGQKFIFVQINFLHQALVSGVSKFLEDSFKDKHRWAIIEPRLNELCQPVEMEPDVAALVSGKM